MIKRIAFALEKRISVPTTVGPTTDTEILLPLERAWT